MPETNNIENNQAMQFDAIQIGLASPERSESGHMARLKSLRPLTIEH